MTDATLKIGDLDEVAGRMNGEKLIKNLNTLTGVDWGITTGTGGSLFVRATVYNWQAIKTIIDALVDHEVAKNWELSHIDESYHVETHQKECWLLDLDCNQIDRQALDKWTDSPEGRETAANDTAAKATHETGYIERDGDHKGEIYGGIFPDGNPGWISEEPKRMNHFDAVELKGRALPTREEGKYIDTIKGKGALKDIFARYSDGSSSAGFFWLAEHDNVFARYQQFSDGAQSNYDSRKYLLPVLSVRR